jgi:SlyX protein
MTDEERLIDIETALACQQKMTDELNEVVIRQGKEIDRLQKELSLLCDALKNDQVKPLSEETPPPHY